MDSEDVLARAKAGDTAAVEQLLRAHEATIYRFARKHCGRGADAEDALQETMLALAEGVADVRSDTLSSWLYTVARNACRRRRRKSKFAPEVMESLHEEDAVIAVPDTGPRPDAIAIGRELDAALDAALAQLSELDREVLILRDFEGLAASEVASVLELSVSAVKSRLHRARIELRDRMQRALGAQVPRDPACPDVAQLFSRKLEDELDAGTCAEMESHLDGCPRCAADCAALKRTLALCSQSADEPVPEAVQDRVRRAVSELLRRAR